MDVLKRKLKTATDGIPIVENLERTRLFKAAREWRAAFDSIRDMVFVNDRDFRIVRMNRACAEVLGRSPKDLVGKACYRLFHGRTKPPPDCPYKRVLENKITAESEFFEPRLGFHAEEIVSPLLDKKDDLIGSVHIIKNINPRKRDEEKLRYAERLSAVGELAAGIAHEIRNPLANIYSTAQYCLAKNDSDQALKKHLDVIVRNSSRANEIIKALLNFAGSRETSLRPGSIREVVNRACELVRVRCQERGVRLSKRVVRRLPEIAMDEELLERAFLNLLGNAIEAMPKGGKLNVTVYSDPGTEEITVKVADTGEGIPADKLNKIFRPFYSGKKTGVGLGLSLVQQAVSQHKGKINVISSRKSGTEITVTFPVSR